MSRIKNAFKNKKAFVAFLTAGDPSAEKTVEFALALGESGVDLIEIGIPFSDPAAEGTEIQNASIRALEAGMNLSGVFDIVKKIREKSDIPLVFLTYLNPIHHFGYQAFFEKCKEIGVDGIIVPDMPFEEKGEIATFAKTCGVDLISFVAPTLKERIQKIAKEAEGFIYVVPSMDIASARSEIKTDLSSIVQAVREVSDTPTAIDSDISTPEQAKKMTEIADGVIIASAIVKIIEEHGENSVGYLKEYACSIKNVL